MAVSITGGSLGSTLAHGNLMTLMGSGFESHGDHNYSGSATYEGHKYLCYLFHDFNGGTVEEGGYEITTGGGATEDHWSNNAGGPSQGGRYVEHDGDSANASGLGSADAGSDFETAATRLGHMRCKMFFDQEAGDASQVKVHRIFTDSVSSGMWVQYGAEPSVSGQFSLPNDDSGSNKDFTWGAGFRDAWFNFDLKFKWESSSSADDSQFILHFDETEIADRTGSENNTHPAVQFEANFSGHSWDWHNNNNSGADYKPKTRYTDALINFTWAEVLIGDASTFAACTNLEYCPPTAWANGEVTAVINQGAHSNFSGKYVYIRDSAGNVNANGFDINSLNGGGGSSVGRLIILS